MKEISRSGSAMVMKIEQVTIPGDRLHTLRAYGGFEWF